jgi:hypothetical protein
MYEQVPLLGLADALEDVNEKDAASAQALQVFDAHTTLEIFLPTCSFAFFRFDSSISWLFLVNSYLLSHSLPFILLLYLS